MWHWGSMSTSNNYNNNDNDNQQIISDLAKEIFSTEQSAEI